MSTRGCFVTGTDTEVGKTRIACAVLHLLGAGGVRAAGFKPVAAGATEVDGRLVNDDVQALRAAGTVALDDAEVGPVQLRTACAPHIAAAVEGVAVDRAALLRAARHVAARSDRLVVEGVGGFRVPLGDDWDSADLACDLGLPVVLVVGVRLGCISHALLTAEAVRARGLHLAGWVANRIGRDMPHVDDNVAALRRWLGDRHGAPCLGDVPWLEAPGPAEVAAHLDAAALRALLGRMRPVPWPPADASAAPSTSPTPPDTE